MPIQPEVIETNADLLSANLFTFSFVDLNLESPNFNRLEGLNRTVETIEQPDGGTGLIRKYAGGVIRYDDVTVVRVRDGSDNDRLLSQFITEYFATGPKRDALAIKRHKGEILRRIEFLGLNTTTETLPSYDNATAAPEEISYVMTCDYWEELF